MINDMDKVKIVEFDDKYEEQAKEVIYRELRKLGRLNENQVASPDSDLNHIGEIYKGRSRFWLALQDDKVVGTTAIKELNGSEAELVRMYVLSEMHGTGVGQKLFNQALEFVASKNYKKIVLCTNKIMQRAQRFYEKNGFVKISEDDDKLIFELVLSSYNGK